MRKLEGDRKSGVQSADVKVDDMKMPAGEIENNVKELDVGKQQTNKDRACNYPNFNVRGGLYLNICQGTCRE